MKGEDRAEQLRRRLVQIEAARGALDPKTYEEIRRELEDELRALDAGSDERAAPDVHAAQRSLAIGRDAIGNVILIGGGKSVPATEADPELLLEAYLSSLADECGLLPLGTIDTQFVRGGGERRVRLPEVYVELDVTVSSQPNEEGDERGWAWRLMRGDATRRMSAGEALARRDVRRHALLGDPGSGKTTLSHRLCGALAARDAVPDELRGLVPLRFVSRDVASRHLPQKAKRGTAGMLWNALAEELRSRLGEDAGSRLLAHVQRRVMEKGGFVVVDGIDEVPESGRRRELLLQAVADLAGSLRKSPSRFLVTARPYAYANPELHLEGFEVLALAPFTEEQIEHFIRGWYLTAARRAFSWSEETARGKADQLRAALRNRRYLGDLASRPLLLTLMATLHSSWGQLPEDRADLYEETVKLLLGRWQRARETKADGEPVSEESLSELLRVPEYRLREALESLAFSVHERQASDPERDEYPADIPEGDLLVAFKPLLGEVGPEDLLSYLEDRAGLLVNRSSGTYAFPHRSIQEYLCACHLRNLPDPTARFRERAFEDPVWWREVVLLGIGRVRRAGLGDAVNVVTTLLPAGPEETEEIADEHWRVAVLCGQGLLDLRILGQMTAELPHYKAVLKRTRDWLARLVEEGRLSPKERVEAGDVLGRLGDPRTGVGTLQMEKAGGVVLPDVAWEEVPAGTFTMGSADDDPLAWKEEKPQHEVHLDRFWISRYPITNAQFRPFVESDGYSNRDYWTEAGWEWLEGAEVDVSVYPEEVREEIAEWLAARPKEKRRRPFFWDHERFAAPTRPVVGITWYEALAYCRWLNARVEDHEALLKECIPSQSSVELVVGLPTEAQWEKAARGNNAVIWPWGLEFGKDHCNTKECEIGETSPVGMFPKNRSRYGAFDMCGNVWEWTISIWSRDSVAKPDFGYPYRSVLGWNDISSRCLRIVRGGSWYDDNADARCAARLRAVPGFFVDIGFRVVLSLAHSEY